MKTDRWTKALVAVSAFAAVIYEVIIAGRFETGVRSLAVGSALVAWVAGRRWQERGLGWILALGPLLPLFLVATTGHFRLWLLSPWVGALIAAAIPTASSSWQYPRPWRFPLIAWALAIAVTWPLVALRELDWTVSLLWTRPSVRSTAVHGIGTSVWIAEVAQVHLLGLLLIDWLFGRFRRTDGVRTRDFERAIVWPSLATAVAGAVVATYQGFFQLRFLATGPWAALERASGMLADANASGMLGALWVAIPLGLALASPSRGRASLLTVCSLLLALGVWATGSRTALLCAVIALASGVHLAIAGTRASLRGRAMISAAAAVVVLTVGALVWDPPAMGPVRRIQSLVPDYSASTLESVAWELWARNGYGLAAVAAIRDSPWSGVGVGTFHLLSPDYSAIALGSRLPHDNAQNWFRHQLAELGILGSVGWAGWLVFFVTELLRGSVAAADRSRRLAASYAVIGFGMASLLGMPGQSLLITLAFWTLAFWVLLLADSSGSRLAGDGLRLRQWPLVAALALAAAFGVMTLFAGMRELRPPFRAKRFGYGYRYGMHQPLEGTSGKTRTTAHAVDVPEAHTRWLKLTVWVDHPDANERPVAVQVWRDHERIISRGFPRSVPLTRYVAIPGENRRFVFEATVDRTFQPAAAPGGAEVGLSMSWEFVKEPPAAYRGDSGTR